MIDAFASQRHYIDHLAPVWHELSTPGTFWVTNKRLVEYALSAGIPQARWGLPNTPGPPTLVASYHDLTDTHHGRRIAHLEHGIGQTYVGRTIHDHPSYSGGAKRTRIELHLCPNEMVAARERAAYPRAQVEVVGSPLLDTFGGAGTSDRIVLAWHWPLALCPETMWAWPHYRKAVRELPEVLGHGHPRAWPTLVQDYAHDGIDPEPDLGRALASAAVVVFDNTSAGYYAAALGIPVVAVNLPTYRRDVHHGLRFWDAVPGPQVDHPAELDDAIAEAQSSSWAERAAELCEPLFPHRGLAAQRAAAALDSWL